MAGSSITVSRWIFFLFCLTSVTFAHTPNKTPTRALGHRPRTSPTPQEAALNIKRALKQGLEVFKRDVCEDAFPGEGAVTNTCNPSNTLCCIRKGESYPQCQNLLNKGWCCIDNPNSEPGCYVDQPSVCEEADSVPCANLEAGVDQACCPGQTTCASGYKFTEKFVRCQILSADLVSLASASAAPTSSSSIEPSSASPTSEITSSASNSVSSASSSVPATASDVLSNAASSAIPPPPSSNSSSSSSSSSLSGGAIAGIAIGPTLALVVGVGLWFLYKRRQKKKMQQPYAPAVMYQDAYPKAELASEPVIPGPYKYQHAAAEPPQEMPVQYTYELDGGAHRGP
ncbi:hypothetical protein J4E81_009155 [Alternaria sp. BMP 2799]|nr:hypothetical protein J4E81_009155 [Alternaria sp. BMP 2799]